MSSPIRAADWEHFSIVRESLSEDGLHVAMVGCDRHQLLDYAAALAVALAEHDGWHIEKYDPQRLETLIVEQMLNRFDAALQTLSGHAQSPIPPRRPGCILFVPDAQSMPSTTFRQLVRLVAGSRDHRLRLVALFAGGDSRACEDRIAAMGNQVARWDLDDESPATDGKPILPTVPITSSRTFNDFTGDRRYRSRGRLITAAAATATALVAVLTMTWPSVSEVMPFFPQEAQTETPDNRLTELAGASRQTRLHLTVMPVHDKADRAENDATRAETSTPERAAASEAEDR